MGTLLLLQIGLDLGLIAVITVLFMERSKAKNTDDPRLSRGLQLLSSKIAILQDLMDRAENSGKQLTQLIEAKQQDVHETLEDVERHLGRVGESMEKSKSIARLFEDKIPHAQIIERQNAKKYLTAAKLANQGRSVDEIAQQCDIPRGELELIVKLNRNTVVAPSEHTWMEGRDDISMKNLEDVQQSFTATASTVSMTAESQSLVAASAEYVAEELRATLATPAAESAASVTSPAAPATAPQTPVHVVGSASSTIVKSSAEPQIRPVVFKRISVDPKFL